jgi:hypothetical protein
LFLDRQGIPSIEVVQVLLDNHVAATGKRWVLLTDYNRRQSRRTLRVLGPVHEPEQVTLVKRPEPVHLIDYLRERGEAIHQPFGKLEAQIEAMRANVKQQIAGCSDSSMSRAGKPWEWMQPSGTRLAKQALPQP